MVVEATREEHVSKISEVIQGFCTRIKEFEVWNTLGTPPEEKEQIERTIIISVASIKMMDEECRKICE
jgi:hypothetical protein